MTVTLDFLVMGEMISMYKNNEYYYIDNERIVDIATIRSILTEANFFEEELLQNVCNNLKETEGLGSYISSFSILSNYDDMSIKLVLRKTFFKRFEGKINGEDQIELYNYISPAVIKAFDESFAARQDLAPLANVTNSRYVNQLYNIYVVGENTIIISF